MVVRPNAALLLNSLASVLYVWPPLSEQAAAVGVALPPPFGTELAMTMTLAPAGTAWVVFTFRLVENESVLWVEPMFTGVPIWARAIKARLRRPTTKAPQPFQVLLVIFMTLPQRTKLDYRVED